MADTNVYIAMTTVGYYVHSIPWPRVATLEEWWTILFTTKGYVEYFYFQFSEEKNLKHSFDLIM